MNKFTRRIAAVGVTVAATGAAIVGSVIAAPAASAAVPSGDYTFTTTAFGIPSTSPARVDGDKLTLFSPIGPITPAAQAPGAEHAAIRLQVNGEERQRSSTAQLIWSVAETIAHLSAAWELQPGDLIFTGTPEGVAAVQRGDRLECSVEGLVGLRLEVA